MLVDVDNNSKNSECDDKDTYNDDNDDSQSDIDLVSMSNNESNNKSIIDLIEEEKTEEKYEGEISISFSGLVHRELNKHAEDFYREMKVILNNGTVQSVKCGDILRLKDENLLVFVLGFSSLHQFKDELCCAGTFVSRYRIRYNI